MGVPYPAAAAALDKATLSLASHEMFAAAVAGPERVNDEEAAVAAERLPETYYQTDSGLQVSSIACYCCVPT